MALAVVAVWVVGLLVGCQCRVPGSAPNNSAALRMLVDVPWHYQQIALGEVELNGVEVHRETHMSSTKS